MRHRKGGKKFNRNKDHRKSLFRNLTAALLEHESIRTTEAKAKEISRLAEKIISFAKLGTLSARREAAKVITDKKLLNKIFNVLGPRFKDRKGGYTRIYKLKTRLGDNAPIVLLELVEKTEKEKPKKKKPKAEEKKAKERKAAGETDKVIEKEKEKEKEKKEKEEGTKRIERKRKFPGFTRIFKRKSFGLRPEK